MADRRRVAGDPAGDERLGQQLRVAGVAAGRRLRGGGGRGGRAGRGRPAQPEALDVARRRRHRDPAHRRAGLAADHRAGPDARRAPHLVRATGAAVAVQRDLPAVPARGVRPGDRRAVRADVALRLGPAADHLARRRVAGLRHAARGPDRPAAARAGVRRRALARLSRPARRPGVGSGRRHAAGHVVHARFVGGGRLVRGQDLARPGHRGVRADPGAVPRADRAGDRPGAGVRVPGRRPPAVHGAADPRRGAVARRNDAGVRGARPALRQARPGGGAAAPDRARHGRGAARVVARRRLDRVRYLVSRRRPPLQGARGRQRPAGAADHPTRDLPVPGVVAGRSATGGDPGTRPQLPRGGAPDRTRRQRQHRVDPGRRRRLDAGGAHRRAQLPAHDVRPGPHLPLSPGGRPGIDPLGRNGREGAREGQRSGATRRRRPCAGGAGADGADGRPGAGPGPPRPLHAGGALCRGRYARGVGGRSGACQRARSQADGAGRTGPRMERRRPARALVDRQRPLHLRSRRRGNSRAGGACGRGRGGRHGGRGGADQRRRRRC